MLSRSLLACRPLSAHARSFPQQSTLPSPAPVSHMKKLIWLIYFCAIQFLLVAATLISTDQISLAAGPAPDVYIASRTDGERGDGSSGNPYDGSTEARFDAFVGRSGSLINTPCTIYLGRGTFSTKGVLLNINSRLMGAGMS